MLKGCTPSDDDSPAFYNVSRIRKVRRIYAAMVAEWDAMVGAYMQTVKDLGVWNNTVWIVTSDHGDMQMEHQQHYKMVPYDASACVPMVMFDGRPGKQIHGGKVITTMTQLIDIFPTVMELAGVSAKDYPSDLDGYSLMPLFDDKQVAVHDHAAQQSLETARPAFVVSQFHGDNIAMSWFLCVQTFDGGSAFKLIVYGTGAEVPSMLFNLTADPNEYTNLIDKPAYATIQKELDTNMRTVVDYPKIALNVANYNKDSFMQWVNTTKDWPTQIHKKGIRWDGSYEVDTNASLAAIKKWMSEPAKVVGCRASLSWPEKEA